MICNSERETHGVDPADGRILWSAPGGGKAKPVVAHEYGGDFLLNLADNWEANPPAGPPTPAGSSGR